jgi:very-short-patch-repair endonuclease
MSAARPRRLSRAERAVRAAPLAERHDGVVHRRDLRAAGVDRADVRTEVAAGRWTTHGIHTVQAGTGALSPEANRWRAVWESGSGAVLDGASALHAVGLIGYTTNLIQVTVPRANRRHAVDGVRSRRRRVLGPVASAGLPRVRPEWAALRAAEWARTDREAVLVLCLVVQQRLTHPDRLLAAWQDVAMSRRRRLLDAAIGDICDGAHSLGELDMARLCRRAGLPQPSRQVVRHGPGGRVYLDVAWEDVGLVLEIDGGQHALALNPVDDALRQNEVTIASEMVLRIPVLGLRLQREQFMEQVVRAHRVRSARAA